jgi:hypothetical protein
MRQDRNGFPGLAFGDSGGVSHGRRLPMGRGKILIVLVALATVGCADGGSSSFYSERDSYIYYDQNGYYRSSRGQIRGTR